MAQQQRVLVTGAFGNVGTSAVRELLNQGHTVRCFDLKSKATERAAKKLDGRAEVQWGDIRNPQDVRAAAKERDVVIHLVAIIPPLSEARPEWSRGINVGGTRNVVEALQAQTQPPKLIYTSSFALFGRDQSLLHTASDPIQPSDHYTHHKAECEKMIRESSLRWCIFRLGAVVPVAIRDLRMTFREMFEVPLSQPIECVHTSDVGLALANAVSRDDLWGKTLLIGGGRDWQLYQRQFYQATLGAMGIGMFPDEAFTSEPFHTHWMDTTESQQLLHYQRTTLADYVRELRASLGIGRYFIPFLRPLIRYWILKQSPYYGSARLSTNRKQNAVNDEPTHHIKPT